MSRWNRNELMLVMNLYTKLRYGQFNYKNSEVIRLAELIGKTPGAVAFKLVHLSRQDPEHRDRIKGLANPGRNAVEMYNEFANNWDEMLFESEALLAKYQNKNVEEIALSPRDLNLINTEILLNKEGLDVSRMVKTRVNQTLFRRIVVNNYSNSCAICNLDISNLLVASHILKWSGNQEQRLNPENGICLCSIHDRAFELGYIGIDANYRIHISNELSSIKDRETFNSFFERHSNQQLNLPDKFYPNKDFLKNHYDEYFRR